MFVRVNGENLYFDVEGAGLVADGDAMREKPTIILLHGGPGTDHSIYKPAFSCLADIAQVIYLDHRGNGRSSGSDPSAWTLVQWGDDVRAFCDALGIEKPIVYGASFGGFVAQAYATRHPGHPGKLILASTAAKFDFPAMFEAFARFGGPEAGAAARAYWSEPSTERRNRFIELCVPLYSTRPPDMSWLSRAIRKDDVAIHFNGPNNEQGRMDFIAALATLPCPTLVLSGERDPVVPIAVAERLAAALPRERTHLVRFPDAAHMLATDAGDAFFREIRNFVAG